MSIPIICESVSKDVSLGDTPLTILDDVSFTVEGGESLAIVGASGSGKSTLLGIMAGLDTASRGKILMGGHDLSSLDEEARAKLRAHTVGFVFQSFQLIGSLTALQNVMLPLELQGVKQARAQAEHWLNAVGLSERISHLPKQLSGGEQQRVAIARAFVANPKLLFADEPTGNLDSKTGKTIEDLLFSLNETQKTTLILVTHDSALANRCHRTLTLDAGRLSHA